MSAAPAPVPALSGAGLPGPAARAGRLLVAAALAGAGLVLAVAWPAVVPLEAAWSARALRLVFGSGVGAAQDVVWTGIGSPALLGMRLTLLCSTGVLLVPLLLAGGALVAWLRRCPLPRVLAGVALGLAVAVAANQLRFALLVALWRAYGEGGFVFGHQYAGSLLVIILFALSMYLMVRLAAGLRRVATPAAASEHPAAGRNRKDALQ